MRKALATIRWTVERARAAYHQRTPLLALPSALYKLFAADGRTPPQAAQ